MHEPKPDNIEKWQNIQLSDLLQFNAMETQGKGTSLVINYHVRVKNPVLGAHMDLQERVNKGKRLNY